MNLKELKEKVDRLVDIATKKRHNIEEVNVGIKVHRLGAVGATPTVDVSSISLGFDWDSGKCLIYTDEQLREVGRDEIATLQKKFNDLGWDYYEKQRKIDKG